MLCPNAKTHNGANRRVDVAGVSCLTAGGRERERVCVCMCDERTQVDRGKESLIDG